MRKKVQAHVYTSDRLGALFVEHKCLCTAKNTAKWLMHDCLSSTKSEQWKGPFSEKRNHKIPFNCDMRDQRL